MGLDDKMEGYKYEKLANWRLIHLLTCLFLSITRALSGGENVCVCVCVCVCVLHKYSTPPNYRHTFYTDMMK